MRERGGGYNKGNSPLAPNTRNSITSWDEIGNIPQSLLFSSVFITLKHKGLTEIPLHPNQIGLGNTPVHSSDVNNRLENAKETQMPLSFHP